MVDPKTRDFIRTTIRTYLPDLRYRLFIFGSRALDHHHPYSDVYVGIKGERPVAGDALMKIKESFDESGLPMRVDVVDFFRVSCDFSRIAGSATLSL